MLRKLALLTFYAEAKGIRFNLTEFHRTPENQAERYAQGRTKPGNIITNCDGVHSHSRHEFWEAADIVIVMDDGRRTLDPIPEYTILGEIWEQIGGTWGGRWFLDGKTTFNDIYHFEI